MRRSRVVAITAVLLAVATAATLVAVATRPAATRRTVGTHLRVGPGPLRTATGTLTYHGASGVDATALCRFDFSDQRADVVLSASASIAQIHLEARLVGASLYVNDGTLSSLIGAPWVMVHAPRATSLLGRLGTLLAEPDLSSVRTHKVSSSTNGATTTTTYDLGTVTISFASGFPIPLPEAGHLVLTITTGRQGQVLSMLAALRSATGGVTARFVLTAYNAPVDIAAPSATQTVPLTKKRARQLFGTNTDSVLRLLRSADVELP